MGAFLVRLLLVMALLGLVVVFLRLWRARQLPNYKGEKTAQKLVQCAHCHVYLPQSHAEKFGQHWYCSGHVP